MATYRFYPLDLFDQICGPYSAAVCEDDRAALLWADEIRGSSGVEVWQGARLVCRRLSVADRGASAI